MSSPLVFVRCDSGFVQIVFDVSPILFSIHRVHGCEELTVCPFCCFFLLGSVHFWWWRASRRRSRCGRCTRQSHPVTVHCPAIMDQSYYLMNVPESLGSTRIYRMNEDSSNFEAFFFSPPPFAKQFSQSSTVHCKVPTNFTFNFSTKSSNFTAPSRSREIDESCRSVRVINFDTAKQLWSNGCVSMSIHILSWLNTKRVDKFTTSFSLGLAFATSLSVLMSSWTFSVGIASDVSVTYLLTPFTIRTHEIVWS